jgi:NAD(P)-dependent dehydrogenase (short-subunit alcohol dehydrogenase family)
MTSGSVSSRGRAQDALSGRPKVAIVTGASSGIGLEMVKRLIEKGYRVVANSRNITSAMTLHNTADLKLVDGDIGIEETAKHVVSTAIENFGTVDLLVNNAGVFIPKPFTEYTAEDFRRATQTNLAGFFYVSQLAVAQMRLQKFGHVVNISSSLLVSQLIKPAYRRPSRKPHKLNQGGLGVRHTSPGRQFSVS